MTNAMASPKLGVTALVLVWLMTGCAATRSTFDVPITQAQPATIKGFVKIVEVKDVRRFEAAPRNPSVPSLQNAEEIKDRAITSRAVARKRGGFGAAMADILLPEGRTVEQLVREALTKAVTEKGYSVVDDKSPEFGKALPLQVDIQQFWSWFTPGFFLLSVEFEGILLLKGPVLIGSNEETIRGYSIVKGMVATDNEWQQVMQQGIQDVIEKVKARVKTPD
ncbi:MAG: hypothetical protein ACXV4B_05830 [Halobacteriota archaeon]